MANSRLPSLEPLKNDIAARLRAQLEPHGSANYWLRNSERSQERPYPDDWDTTSCTLSAITLHDPLLLDGKVLGRATQLLTMLEVEPGGPYRTWLTPPEADRVWRDVDVAVNANIAFFLSLHGVRLEKLDAFLVDRIKAGALSSPYYPSALHVLYFLGRAFKNTPQAALIGELALRHEPRNLLESALLATTLSNGGLSKKAGPHLETIMRAVANQTYYVNHPICIDLVKKGSIQFMGSAPLTAALCLEALAIPDSDPSALPEKAHDKRREQMHLQVLAYMRARFRQLSPDLSNAALDMLDKLMQTHSAREITILPYDIAIAWRDVPLKLREEQMLLLCAAHVSGWLAYTIYDDFLDKEGDIRLLSVANTCLRDVVRLFAEVLPCERFQKVVGEVLDTMDSANAWEVSQARLPLAGDLPSYQDLTSLANRSLGITLAPLGVLRHLGYEQDAREVQGLRAFLSHYLTARQLNDDLHDWEEDLKRGHVTVVIARILSKTSTPYRKELLSEYQKIFWYEEIVELTTEILNQVELARRSLADVDLANREMLLGLLDPMIKAAEKATLERDRSLKFLQAFEEIAAGSPGR